MNRIIKYRVVRPPEKEEWAIIEASDGSYYISNLGNVRNKRGKILIPEINHHGYLRVGLCNKEGRNGR